MKCKFCSQNIEYLEQDAVNLRMYDCQQCHTTTVFYLMNSNPSGYIFHPDGFGYELHDMHDQNRTVIIDLQKDDTVLRLDRLIENISPNNVEDWITRLLNLKAFS